MSVFRPIHHSLGPHATMMYCLRTLAISLAFWKYKHGKSVKILSAKIGEFFGGDAFLFASGRESLLAVLHAMNMRAGEEVIIQGYTCVVLPNAIHAAGGVPVYCDIDRETLNLNLSSVMQAITPRTRAIICQHTFGIPAENLRLRTICDERGILFIEDCAHVIPEEHNDSIGKYGDVVLLSFGRDKAVSGIAGGAAISRTIEITDKLRMESECAIEKSWHDIGILLNYPLLMLGAKKFYGLVLGKLCLKIAKSIGALPPILTRKEKEGRMSPIIHTMPNAMAYLALYEWKKLSSINEHRRILTSMYLEHARRYRWPFVEGITSNMAMQKFPLFVRHAGKVRTELKKKNIHLDDGWNGCVICPQSVSMETMEYCEERNPQAEAVCEQILSLPIHPTMSRKDVLYLIKMLAPYLV